MLGIAFANIKALGAVGQVHQHCGHPGHQASHKGDIALFSIIQMAGRSVHLSLIQCQQTFKARQICTTGVDILLMKIICQNVQHNILPGDDHLRCLFLSRCQQRGVDIDALHRGSGMLMPGAGNIGIHILLRKTNLSPDFIRMDFSLANQVVNGGLADMENVCNLLGRKGLILRHNAASLQSFSVNYTLSFQIAQVLGAIFQVFWAISRHFVRHLVEVLKSLCIK